MTIELVTANPATAGTGFTDHSRLREIAES